MTTRHDTDASGMKEIALLYFSGMASPMQEHDLYVYLAADISRLEILRRWEKEWSESDNSVRMAEQEWARLRLKIEAYEEEKRKTDKLRRVFSKIAVAAAIAVVAISGVGGVAGAVYCLLPAKYYSISVPLGERSSITLPDGTVVWLNAGSDFQYSDRFNFLNRKVRLAGEGYFEVAKQKGRPFIVEAGSYDVKVTGTRFNVSAYPDDDFSSVALTEGSVEILYGEKEISMQPGQTVTLDKTSGKFIRGHVENEDPNSWTENRVAFDSITLEHLMTKLSRQYNRNIYIASESLKNRKIHISLRNNESLRDVLNALDDIVPIKYKFTDKDIYIEELDRM